MIVFRNAVQVVICDGCYSVISKPEIAAPVSMTAYTCADGRKGHVCSEECAKKFEGASVEQENVA